MSLFTNAELEVMQVLWRHDALKPADIQKHFPRPVKNATLRSVLRVLLEKGHVRRTREGKAYRYRAVTREEGAVKRALRQLLNGYCGGSSAVLMKYLVETDTLSLEDLDELRKIAQRGACETDDEGGASQ